jgi:hypothetical protein
VVQKIGYLGVLWERKTPLNVPHSLRDGCLLGSHIYGCGRVYLKNEATFGFDQDGNCLVVGMDLRTGNFGDELLNFLDFWRGEDKNWLKP